MKLLFRLLLFCGVIFSLSVTAQTQIKCIQTDSCVNVFTKDYMLSMIPMEDNVLRIQMNAKENDPPQEELVFVSPYQTPKFKFTQSDDFVELKLKKLTAKLDLSTMTLSYYNKEGNLILSEKPESRVIAATQIMDEPTFKVEQSFISDKDEFIYGTGQFQDGYMNVRDLPRRLTQVNTQIAIPMIVSNKGYGFLWHNYGLVDFNAANNVIELNLKKSGEAIEVDVTSTQGSKKEVRSEAQFEGEFNVDTKGRYAFLLDVGQSMARKHYVEIDGEVVVDFANYWLPPTTSWLQGLSAGRHTIKVIGELNDKPSVRFRSSADQTTWSSPVSKRLDYVVFAGNSDQVISSYHKLSGRVPLMPKWSMGYVHCRERYQTQDELLQNAQMFRDKRLPIDMIVQDWQYWGKYGWNAMQFDETRYPEPKKMVDRLHEMNMKLMISVWARIDKSSAVGKEAQNRGYYIDNTQWIDFFNPKAAEYYWDQFSKRLVSLDIDAWWQDATEPENDDLTGRKTYIGSGDKYRNVYPLFVNKTVYSGLRKDAPDKRVFILTRSAFSGQQRYASATWSGDIGYDWETLRRQIPAGLNYVVTGLPWWTTDTGGFFRPEDQYTQDDYQQRVIRWMQYSTFCPIQRVHGYKSNTEPWHYKENYQRIVEKYMKYRYRLLPYTYSHAAAITFGGSSLMRPFVMDFPNDRKALEQKYEYMYGPSLLIAPILEPDVKTWSVYLPNGHQWFDLWTGMEYQGGDDIQTPVAINRIPIYVKAGSIVPLGEEVEYAKAQDGKSLEIRIYPGADAEFILYEDDGESYDYQKQQYSKITLKWDDKSQCLHISDCQGEYEEMSKNREFNVVKVGANIGTGLDYTLGKKINYNGKSIKIKL